MRTTSSKLRNANPSDVKGIFKILLLALVGCIGAPIATEASPYEIGDVVRVRSIEVSPVLDISEITVPLPFDIRTEAHALSIYATNPEVVYEITGADSYLMPGGWYAERGDVVRVRSIEVSPVLDISEITVPLFFDILTEARALSIYATNPDVVYEITGLGSYLMPGGWYAERGDVVRVGLTEVSPVLDISEITVPLSFDILTEARALSIVSTSPEVVYEITGSDSYLMPGGWYAEQGDVVRVQLAEVQPVLDISEITAPLSFDILTEARALSIYSTGYEVVYEIVPAPGAALLAMLGLSMLGWAKRRFA